MIVIADAGGSNTSWRVIRDIGSIDQFQTEGLNVARSGIRDYLKSKTSQLAPLSDALKVHFYVAGLRSDQAHSEEIISDLCTFFPRAEVRVESDLLGAARSLCMNEVGWVGILGTGSNLARYQDDQIVERIPPLGFILGDEGSGAHLGKKLLVDFCRKQMHKEIHDAFASRFGWTEDQILQKIYAEDTRSFLSSFGPFIHEHQHHPYMYGLVLDAFRDHLKLLLPHYREDERIHYTGSIAYYFSNILKDAAEELGVTVGRIVESPIAGLTLYHQQTE